ncbi:MAG: sulfotransferase [Alphaproteobacteria bacterium]
MRWVWPFKSSNGSHRNGNHRNGDRPNGHYGNGYEQDGDTGQACPDFLCVGAQKAGTSWLYRQLEPHPDFWMPPVKELHYLDSLNRTKRHRPPRSNDERDVSFLESIKDLSMRSHIDLESYGRLFCYKGPLLSGDISPAYSTLNDEIVERVVDHFPDIKVVFMARDPVERAWSQLSMGVRLGMINRFDATDPEEVIRNLLNPGVLTRSHPSKVVARWRRYVDPENFRVYFFDDLKENPAALRRSIVHFLGGDPEKPSGQLNPNENNDAGRDKLRLTARVRERVARFFEQELKACAMELGGRARSWPARYGFSLLLLFWDMLDNSIDLFFWCNWIT